MKKQRITVWLLFFALSIACGCAKDVVITTADPDERLSAHGMTFLEQMNYLPITAGFLTSYNLYDDWRTNPELIITRLHDAYEAEPERYKLEIMCNLCYLQGVAEQKNPEKALKYFVSAAYYSYLYFSETEKTRRKADPYDPGFFLMTRMHNYALTYIFDYIYSRELVDSGGYKLPAAAGGGINMSLPENHLRQPIMAYSLVAPCADFRVENLLTNNYQFGLGVPLIAAMKLEQLDDGSGVFETPITPCSMRIDFGKDNTAKLAFYPTLKQDDAALPGGAAVPLETDISTPLAYVMQDMSFWKDLSLMLNPDELAAAHGLYILGDYDPDKIPVVLVHGLMSSPQTWIQMVNFLLDDSKIAANYQFLFFYYSTGQPIIYSAAQLRASLQALAQKYGSNGADGKFNKMVLIGHSMGGLLSKAMIKDGSDEFASEVLQLPIEDVLAVCSAGQQGFLEKMLLFKHQEYIARMVFIAVPHKGSDVAKWGIARWGSSLVTLPQEILSNVQNLMNDVLVLAKLKENDNPIYIATGIDNLDPDNVALSSLDKMPFAGSVPYHSIIGNNQAADLPEGTDGIVPYHSSHLSGAKSELVVKSDHSVHRTVPAIEEVRRILRLHLLENDIAESGK